MDIISEEVNTEHKEEQIPEKRTHRRAGQLRAVLKTLITRRRLLFFKPIAKGMKTPIN